jgi:hypothetical protein
MIVFFHFAPATAFFISIAAGLLSGKSWSTVLIYSLVFYVLFYVAGLILTRVFTASLKGSEEKHG